MASTVGAMRHISAIKRSLRDMAGLQNGNGWQIHIEGACGELALAKCFNLFWDGSINTFKSGGDVGHWQVRTRSKHDYELIVRDNDADDALFWLVTGFAPEYVIHGWIVGANAKMAQWKKAHGGRESAYFVPHNALKTEIQI